MKAKIIQPQPPEPEVAVEVIATSLQSIAKAMQEIDNTRLSRRALVALIHDHSKVSKKTIEVVLNNLHDLERIWLKPVK